jgi:symplekin
LIFVVEIAQNEGVSPARSKILISLVTQFGGAHRTGVFKNSVYFVVIMTFHLSIIELREHILTNIRHCADLALAWLYQEYANYHSYSVTCADQEKASLHSYDECLTGFLTGLLQRPDQREGLFSRLMLEAPLITPNAIQVLEQYCQDETRIYLGMTTLKELILKRPCMKLEFLDVLLEFTSHEKPEVCTFKI